MTPHFLNGTEPGPDGVLRLAARALELRSGSAPIRQPHKRLAAVFLNPSLRTRTSVEFAAAALGVHPVVLTPGNGMWGLEHRRGVIMDGGAAEHMADAVPVLCEMADVLAVRAFARLESMLEDRADPVLQAFADYASKPVINLESAQGHPLQGLADTATWMAHLGPELKGKKVALTWAPHPKALPAAVANQVLTSAALIGMNVSVAHPEGFNLDPNVVERAEKLAAAQGAEVEITHFQHDALTGADVVVSKSWSGFSYYGQREHESARRRQLSHWMMDQSKMPYRAGFMHCLPIRRNVVAADGLLDGPSSWVHETAGLRMWTAMALLEQMLAHGGGAWNA